MNLNEDSKPERTLSNFTKLMIVLVLFIGSVFVLRLNKAIERARGASKIPETVALLSTCRFACLSFHSNANRWPVALAELMTNTNGIVYITGKGLLDSWARPFIYVAPVGTNVPGYIQSLGADGLPGGANSAADITFTIP